MPRAIERRPPPRPSKCRLVASERYNGGSMSPTARNPPSMAAAMAAQAESAAELLKTLGNPQRLRILCLLVEGEHSVGEINAHVTLSQSALSQHLAVLREQALVETRREAQTIYYTLAEGPARALLGTLHDLYCPTPGARSPQAERPKVRKAGKPAPRHKAS